VDNRSAVTVSAHVSFEMETDTVSLSIRSQPFKPDSDRTRLIPNRTNGPAAKNIICRTPNQLLP
jgi:hypothetical protein